MYLKVVSGVRGTVHTAILQDVKFGFSVKRRYDQKLRFKPSKNSKGETAVNCCIWVSIDEEKISGTIYPLIIKVRIYDDRGIIERQLQATEPRKPTLFEPIELESFGEYNYDASFRTLGKPGKGGMSGNDILEQFFQKHILPTRPIKGILLRGNIGFRRKFYEVANQIIFVLNWTLKFTTRKFLSKEPINEFDFFYFKNLDDPIRYFNQKDIKCEKADEIKAFNYSTTKPTLIVGCGMLLALIAIFNFTSLKSIQIKGESAMWVVIPILIFWLVDTVAPLVVMLICNALIFLKLKLCFMNVKV